jgi:hypothetical protein
MAICVDRTNSEVYIGTFKASGSVYPGDVVYASDSAGTATIPTTTDIAAGYNLFICCNYDSYADTDMTDSEDFYVADGEYLRLKAPLVGDIITTDRFIGTYASITKGDAFLVNSSTGSGTQGKWIAITTESPVLRAVVHGKTTLYGNNALQLRIAGA